MSETTTTTRAELSMRYNSTRAKIKAIEDSSESFLYATHSKYIPKLGYVGELSMQGVVQAAKFLNDLNASSFETEMEEFGIKQEELGLAASDKYLGINISIWKNDLKTRINELRQSAKLNALKSDAEILYRNLDKDNLFELDMMKLSSYSDIDTVTEI